MGNTNSCCCAKRDNT